MPEVPRPADGDTAVDRRGRRQGMLAKAAEAQLEDNLLTVDTWCSCNETHKDRPEGRHGCGVGFRLLAVKETAQ